MSGRVDSHGQPTHGCALRPLEAGDAGELLTLRKVRQVIPASGDDVASLVKQLR